MIGCLGLLAAYFIGAIPFGFLLVRIMTGQDVRSASSGNIGATNVLRTTGRMAGVLTLILDIAKGYLAVWLVSRMTHGNVAWSSAAAIAVMAGHAFPVFLKFRGGKAVASFIGAFAFLTPAPLFAVLLVFVAVVWATRFISLGSITAAGTFPLAVWLIDHAAWPVEAAAIVGGLFIVYRHRSNLERLRAGTESMFRFGGGKRST